ncbi:MAG: wax ester/triacylglycerol synthase family O-acyltransferase [Acidimicrobiales bacterium]
MSPDRADEPMSDLDALIWVVDREPRRRSTIAMLAIVREPIETTALRHRVERASRVVPRMRQRVIEPGPGLRPQWAVDEDFRLSSHLRATHLTEPSDACLLDVVGEIVARPFDRARPLWEIIHIGGLADGGQALVVKAHHAVCDGLGGVALLQELFDTTPDAPDRALLPPPPRRRPGSDGPRAARRAEVGPALAALRRGAAFVTRPRSVDDLAADARELGATLGSAARMYAPPRSDPAVPAARSAGLELRRLSLSLDDLRAAGRRVGATINDAFVTAVAHGLVDHHRPGAPATVTLAIPISTRAAGDDTGNHWSPGRLHLAVNPNQSIDGAIAGTGRALRRVRHAPAHSLIGPIAAAAHRLPRAAAERLYDAATSGCDATASNVPGCPIPLHVCGTEIEALVPFGPLTGGAVNVTLSSYAGVAHIGIVTDPAAIVDADGFARDLAGGLTAVVKGT